MRTEIHHGRPPRGRHLRGAIAALALVPLAACSNDAARTLYAPKPMPVHALASAPIDASAAALPLQIASLTGHVVTTAKAGCTSDLTITSAAKNGTCKLTLRFGPRADGPGLGLTTATLVARDASGTCTALADRLPAGDADVIYSATGGGAWLPWVEPPSADAVKGEIAVDKVLAEVRGEIALSAAGDSLTLSDRSVQIGGDVTLVVDDAATCTPCASKACLSPYPQLRLRDAQPQSVAYNLAYSLDRWLGQYLVVILTQGW